jgi:hypothetical protein
VSGPRPEDIDAQWQRIVAHWEDVAPEAPQIESDAPLAEVRPQPAPPPGAAGEPLDPTGREDPLDPTGREDPLGSGWRSYEPAPEDDHWEPPAPAPLPPPQDGTFWAALVGLVGGPVLLFAVAILRPDYGTWWALLAVAVTVTGFTLLVRRGGVHRDDDDFGIRL